jgi:pimeloyl-ACP methyl ester carboxylesterase
MMRRLPEAAGHLLPDADKLRSGQRCATICLMAARPTCVLLPGFDGSGQLFAPLLAAARLPFEPSVLSLPTDTPRDYDQLVDWVVARLPADRPFALLAESFSGPLAIRIAARHPIHLTHLILAATFLRAPLNAWLSPLGALAGPILFARPPPAWAVRLLLAGRDADAALVASLRAAMVALPPTVAAARARTALEADERAALSRIAVPTLMLRATRDRLLRLGHADDALASLPSAQVASIDGPHLILQRRPRECLEVIARLLAF